MKYFNAFVAICACTVAAASAQTLGVDKNPVNFSAQFNGPAVTQTVNVTGSGTFTTFVDTGWLKVNPINGSAPSALTLTADPTGLAPATYGATLSIFGANRVDVRVNLTVSSITVNPPSIQFASQIGSTPPAAQTLTLSGGAATPYTATAATATGGGWLLITGTGGSPGTTASGTSPGTLSISLNPAVMSTLAAGTYNGTVTVTPGSSGAPITVPVTLVVSPSPAVTISPSAVSLFYQVGGSNNLPQQVVTLSSAGSQGVPFSIVTSVDNNPAGRTWFTVAPGLTGTIPPSGTSTALTFSYDTSANLPAGTYKGKATISTPGGTPAAQDIPVTLIVSNSALLAPSASSLNFTYQMGTPAPAAQNLTVSSTAGATPLTLSATTNGNSGNWLTVPGNGTAGTAFPVTVNPTGLAAGNYTGTISVSAGGATNSPLAINVNLQVTNDPVIVAGVNGCSTANQPCPMTFAFQTGQAAPANQVIQLSSSTGATLNYNASFSSSDCGGNWLSIVSPTGSTNGSILAAPNVTGVPAGKCNGTITVIATNPTNNNAAAPNSPLTIPVSLYVSATPLLVVSSNGLTFNGQINGATPPSQTITLTSTSPTDQLNYNVAFTTSTGANWLFVSPTSGTTANGSNVLTVLAFPGILSAGVYSGTITITATGPGNTAVADSPVTIPVIFNVNAGTISATPTSLNFTQLAGGSAPAAQTINVAGTPSAINYSVLATADGNGTWLTATPANGSSPGTIQVSASAGSLPVGQYTGKVTITAATPPGASGSPISIPVTLNVVAAQTLTASPNNVNFTAVAGQAAPPSQTVAVASTGAAVPFTVKVDQGSGSWLTVTPTSGNTNTNLTLAVNPQGLTANKYTATVTISSTASLTPTTVTVTLTVSNPVPPITTAIVNAASYNAGGVSPGENVVIFGIGLGPATLAGPVFNPNGSFGTTVSDTQVTFDNIPAPILYVSATQSSVMVPYEIAGRATTVVRIIYKGVTSDPLTYNVVNAMPGIYTQNSQGTGPGSILNQDNSVNGPSNPAAKNSVVAIYMTGEGSTNPQSTNGAIAGSPGNPLNKPTQTVTATVGGLPANVEYAGSAPGILYGVMQVNVRIPANTPSGAQPVVVTVGGTSSKTGVTVSVQ